MPTSVVGRYTEAGRLDRLTLVTDPMSLPAPYQQMAFADELLDRPDELRDAYERDGYLFFRGVLDRAEVDRVAGDLLAALRAEALVEPPADGRQPARWSGRQLDAIDDRSFYEVPYYPELIDTGTTQRFLLRVFGEPVFTFRSLTVRYALPADDRHISLPHQDHFFIRHTAAFRTLWVPLLPIEPAGGALAVAAGSHRAGLRRHEETDVLSYVLKGRRQRGLSLDDVPQPWHTTTYLPGDALLFHSHALHWALPNQSESVRLSMDVRCQPASEPRSWQSRTTLAEQRELRVTAQAIAAAEGMSEELFEKVIIEMMARGVPAERDRMNELASSLR